MKSLLGAPAQYNNIAINPVFVKLFSFGCRCVREMLIQFCVDFEAVVSGVGDAVTLRGFF